MLKDLGCDVVQGYIYAPALAPQAFGRWLLGYSASRARILLEQIRRSFSACSVEASAHIVKQA